jgi:hypothetical protein
MTMPYGSTEEPTETQVETQSVPIHVVSSALKPGKPIGAEFGRIKTYTVANVAGAGTTIPGAQRILNRSLRRSEARIAVLASAAGQAVTDGAIFGSRDEINSGNPATIGNLGGFLPIGKDLVFKAQAELWVCFPASNAGPVFVTVTDFQWASGAESYQHGMEE